jgi:cytochrome bd-type quinol oxidase subunit 2
VSLDDWVKALHLLSAFALVGAMTLLWLGYLAMRAGGDGSPRLVRFFTIGSIVVQAGIAGTLVFGVWLSFSLEGYRIWDGWILAALVLWAIASALGGRAGVVAREPGGLAQAIRLHAMSSALIVLILIDMVWKPGA